MRRDVLGAARFLVLPTLAVLAIAVFAPGRLGLGIRIYALVVCAAVIVLLLLALRRAYPTERVLRERPARVPAGLRPPSLVVIENETALGVASTFDLHFRLVPRLRAVAAGLLRFRRAVSLSGQPDTSHAILGDEAWELARPGRPAPEDRLATGISPRDLGHVVDALEAI